MKNKLVAVLIISVLLTACMENDKALVGTTKTYYDFECVKEETTIDPGISTKGDITFTPHTSCIISKCFQFEKTYGIHSYENKIVKTHVVADDLCLAQDRH